ncbi:hypothetical protein BT93_F0963 [Corymbia citriodora subsp. variegata]|nr:hypothetical protein BT93_F0963 [Corymbia citriodora subsp. variegata]
MNPIKQAEVRKFVRLINLCCIGLLETKVPLARFPTISSSLLPGWMWVSNYEASPRGRIWVGWNPLLVCFTTLTSTDQIIHGDAKFLSSGTTLSLTVVYGEHTFSARRPLWRDLIRMSSLLKEKPWMVAGDFNAIRDSSDYMGSLDI